MFIYNNMSRLSNDTVKLMGSVFTLSERYVEMP